MKRKYAESNEERTARMAREKAMGITPRKRLGGGAGTGEAAVDYNVVMKLLEEKRQSLPLIKKEVDLEIVIKHDQEQ